MPILGLVVTLERAVDSAPLMAALATFPGLSIGQACGERLPLVLEVDGPRAVDTSWRALSALPGVALIELAFADFSELEQLIDYEPPQRERPFLGGDHGPA